MLSNLNMETELLKHMVDILENEKCLFRICITYL